MDSKKTSVSSLINGLLDYAQARELVVPADRIFHANHLCALMRIEYDPEAPAADLPLADLLGRLCDAAAAAGILENDSVVYRDLFDTALMGELTPLPSAVIHRFYELHRQDPALATDYFYRLCLDCNYIRSDRISRDLKWTVPSEYGEIEITVNLSKPEKDPKAIAAAKLLPQSGYPKCALCHENEGYAGSVSAPARQNLRQIPFDMAGAPWFLQYSPYVYYNEHCIALSAYHTPMRIDHDTFSKLLGFLDAFPHYFIGSNADLPIVGGSILSHDHMQGGRHTFPMATAPIEIPFTFPGYPDIEAGIVRWPLSVIRLTGSDKQSLVDLSGRILDAWRAYSDPDADILAQSEGTPHNTITPIGRTVDGRYQLDLVLRNNRTTPDRPLGLFHPHPRHHNIKKENIGLIEVMGLAVLPARLKTELAQMEKAILSGTDFNEQPALKKHAAWFDAFRGRYTFTADNTAAILRNEVGRTFVQVLEDAGVYKCTPDGRAAFRRFLESIG